MKNILILLLMLPIFAAAQTTFPHSRFEIPDSIILQGGHSTLRVYPKQDSVITTDGNGVTLYLHKPKAVLNGRGPDSSNVYGCYVYKYDDQTIIIEYFYNPHTRLWGSAVDTEDAVILEGMEVIRPFPPLRLVPLKPIKPLRASK